MNRRFFLSALTAAPALPAMTVPLSSRQMLNAKIIARAHNRCTPDMLARHLKVTPEVASRVQAQLLRQGVISAPVSGISVATNPTNTGCIPNEAMRPNNLLQKAAQLRDKLEASLPHTDFEPDEQSAYAPTMREDNLLNKPSTS